MPQNLVRIVAKSETLAKLFDSGQGVKVGQSLIGKVAEVLAGSKALLDFNGQKFTAEVPSGLVKGQSITAKVESLLPNIILKISPEGESKTSKATNALQKNLQETSVKITLSNASSTSKATTKGKPLELLPGQTAQGKAVEVLDSGKVRVRIQNAEVIVTPPAQSKQIKIGDPLLLKALPAKQGVSFQIQEPNVPALKIDGARLKSYLPAKQDMGKMMTDLENLLNKNPELGKYKIDSDVVLRLKETLKVLIPRQEKTPDSSKLKEQVDRSGINYEAKVKKAVDEGLILDKKPMLSKDLKGQLMELQGKLEKYLAKEGDRIPPPTERTITETIQQVKLASDNIEMQQLSNKLSKQEQNPLLLQIPDPYFPEAKTVKFFIRDNGEGEGGKSGDRKGFHMVFLLNLSNIGDIRIDANLNGTNVAAEFASEDKSVVNQVDAGREELRKKLEELGFSASINASVKEKAEMEMEDTTEEALKEVSTRLVDIKT